MLACGLNLVLIPLLIWPLAALAGVELGPGMIVAAATPSTLASAAVLYYGELEGTTVSAILATILTNASCFLVMPFWIFVQTGNEVESRQADRNDLQTIVFCRACPSAWLSWSACTAVRGLGDSPEAVVKHAGPDRNPGDGFFGCGKNGAASFPIGVAC